jgi:hypothetical protein
MNKLVLGALFGLLALGFSSAQAQYFPPTTTPYVRQPLFPYSGAPGPFSPYGLGIFGTSPYGTAPFGSSPYNVVPFGAGTGFTGTTGTGTTSIGLNDPSVTGHPTRFFNYSRYFFNQGGAGSSPQQSGTRPVFGTNPTAGTTPLIGTSPPRGKANTGTGSK